MDILVKLGEIVTLVSVAMGDEGLVACYAVIGFVGILVLMNEPKQPQADGK